MPSPSAIFTEMVTSTHREHSRKIADNVSNHNALYSRMKERNKVRKDGGYEIVMPLDYAENATYQRYSGYDTLNIQASDVLSAAKFEWVQAAVHVTASGRELRMNAGKNQIINLVKARETNAYRTAGNNMSVDLYSSGALANQMGGLAHIIQTNGQGTVGGINSATYTFWRNQFREIAGTNTWSKSTISGEMKGLWMTCVRGADKPDLIVSTHDFYKAYWEGLTELQRYTTSTDSTAKKFESVKFVGNVDVIYDSNDNFSTTGETMYFINTNYLELVEHPDADWSPDKEKMSVNQDAVVIPMLWMGQLCCSNRARQGILIDAA